MIDPSIEIHNGKGHTYIQTYPNPILEVLADLKRGQHVKDEPSHDCYPQFQFVFFMRDG